MLIVFRFCEFDRHFAIGFSSRLVFFDSRLVSVECYSWRPVKAIESASAHDKLNVFTMPSKTKKFRKNRWN